MAAGATISVDVASGGVISADVVANTTAIGSITTGGVGPAGATGAAGADGQGVPTGGAANALLGKINSTNYNTQWVTGPSGTIVGTTDTQTLTNKTLTSPKIDAFKDTDGVKIVEYTPNASGVNYLTQRAGSTGQAVLLSAESITDTNVYFNLQSQGSGTVRANGVDVVTTSGTQTLTNKTLTSPAITTPTGIVKGDVGLGNVDNTSNATERAATATLTNKRITKRTGTTTSSATPTINTDNVDYYSLTAQAVDITSFTTNLSGTPTTGQTLWIAITGTAARAITWGASFEASTVALPTTTVTTNRLDVGFIWTGSIWRCIAAA